MNPGEFDNRLAVSALLPCFEEAGHLEELVGRTTRILQRLCGERWELVLVCSRLARDGTRELAHRLAAHWNNLRVVEQPAEDDGYGRALALGLPRCRLPWIFLLDGDGQFDPEELEQLAENTASADMIVGVRSPRRDPWPRRLAGALYSRAVTALLGLGPVRDLDCGCKLFRRELLEQVAWYSSTGLVNAELLAAARKLGWRVKQIPVRHRPRLSGRSRYQAAVGMPRPREILRLGLDLARLLARNRAGRQ